MGKNSKILFTTINVPNSCKNFQIILIYYHSFNKI